MDLFLLETEDLRLSLSRRHVKSVHHWLGGVLRGAAPFDG